MKKQLLALFLLITLAGSHPAFSQCSMCRKIAESNLESGEKKAKGLNTGILYLMSVPYLMAGVAGFVWWKYRKQS